MQKIIILIFIVFISFGLSAQSLLPTKYGIKIGSNIGNIVSKANDGVENLDNSTLTGFSGGFYMEIALNDKWYINPELIYSQKGASFSYSYYHDYEVNQRDLRTTSNELKLTYIEINPTISYKASKRLALNFAPSISSLLSFEYNILSDKGDDDTNPLIEPLDDATYEEETLDFGLNVGLSYYLEDFLIEGKINTGFMSIGSISKEIYTGLDSNKLREKIYELKNLSIVFSIGYLF